MSKQTFKQASKDLSDSIQLLKTDIMLLFGESLISILEYLKSKLDKWGKKWI